MLEDACNFSRTVSLLAYSREQHLARRLQTNFGTKHRAVSLDGNCFGHHSHIASRASNGRGSQNCVAQLHPALRCPTLMPSPLHNEEPPNPHYHPSNACFSSAKCLHPSRTYKKRKKPCRNTRLMKTPNHGTGSPKQRQRSSEHIEVTKNDGSSEG